jgi:hypothetical protein
MKMKTLLLVTVFVVAGMIPAMAQSNPGSSQAVDTEMELAWPDGTTYINGLNDVNYERYVLWAGAIGTWLYTENWQEIGGGNAEEKATDPPYDDLYYWRTGRWPELGDGYYVSVPGGVPSACDWPGNEMGWNANWNSTTTFYGSYNFVSSDGKLTIQYNAQGQVALITGGEPGVTGSELYAVSGSAMENYYYHPFGWLSTNIPSQQIQIGSLGNLNTNGTLWVVLPAHTQVPVTPHANGSMFNQGGVYAQGYQLVSQCWASTPTNRARTTIGVGETVNVFFQPSLPINVNWTISAGSLTSTSGPGTWLIAPSNATTTTITASIGRQSVSIPFTVVEPSGVDHVTFRGTDSLSKNVAGAGMYMNVYIAPINVSFYRVSMLEVTNAATSVTGYFTSHWPSPHDTVAGAGKWHPIGQDNLVGDGMDHCSYWGSSLLPPPWSPGGSFTWPIPGEWKIGNGPTNSLSWSDQTFSLNANGTMTITKFGHSVTRTTQNVITTQ